MSKTLKIKSTETVTVIENTDTVEALKTVVSCARRFIEDHECNPEEYFSEALWELGHELDREPTEVEADARANEIAQRWGDSLDVIERLLVTHREIICQMMPRTNNLNK